MNKKIKIKQNKANIFFVILGRLVAYSILYFGNVAFMFWAFQNITVYR